MRLLITGGAGFIGSNLIRFFLEKETEDHNPLRIVNLDKLTYAGNLRNLQGIEKETRYLFVHGDIANAPLVENLFRTEHFDAVINLAAESHVDRSISDPSPFITTNVLGTQVLLDAARVHGVKTFLQVSTDEVYGSLEPGDPPFTEANRLMPSSPYSASKAAADLFALAYHHTYGLPVVITRCCNNYGPRQYPEKLIPLVITRALHGLPVPLYGDGSQVRDWINVRDHCLALETVLKAGKPGEVYNVGANQELSNLDLVKAILKELGRDYNLITKVPDRPGHDRRYAVDATKLRFDLGWRPGVNLKDGLAATLKWYVRNQNWWQDGASLDNVQTVAIPPSLGRNSGSNSGLEKDS